MATVSTHESTVNLHVSQKLVLSLNNNENYYERFHNFD